MTASKMKCVWLYKLGLEFTIIFNIYIHEYIYIFYYLFSQLNKIFQDFYLYALWVFKEIL